MTLDAAPARAAPAPARTPGRPSCIPVSLLGRAARRTVAADTRGEVLAVFRRSFYVRNATGDLACFGPPAIGAGPLAALCPLAGGIDWGIGGLRPGAPVEVADGVLRVADRFAFDVAGAGDWRPPALPPGWTPRTLARGLAVLVAEARPRVPPEGLGFLVPELGERRLESRGEMARTAHAAAASLGGWLKAAISGAGGRAADPPSESEVLIGLGPGLTPSGDDFVGGAMIALDALGRADVARRLAAWALARARRRTGAISVAHLQAAAAGEGAEALHRTLAALCAADRGGLSAGLAALDAIGHTSGWDSLAGCVAACVALRDG